MKHLALMLSGALLLPSLAVGAQDTDPKPQEDKSPKVKAGKLARPIPIEAGRIAVLKDIEALRTLSPEALKRVNEFYDKDFGATSYIAAMRGGDVHVNLDLQDATVEEALKHIFSQTKSTYVADDDLPKDVRLTLKASKVRLETALDLITETAGVGWTTSKPVRVLGGTGEQREPVASFHVGRSIPRIRWSFADSMVLPLIQSPGREERNTFTCPHCKGQTTMVRVKQQPKCMKCSRVFQNDWQFCPADGSKRPATPGQWRFCPQCGKQVDPGKAENDAKVPFLGDLPIVGSLFQTKPAPGSEER